MKKRIKVSSGDQDGSHPYLNPAFWVNPTNHFWESARYTESAKEYLREYIVYKAMKEIDKKAKINLL